MDKESYYSIITSANAIYVSGGPDGFGMPQMNNQENTNQKSN